MEPWDERSIPSTYRRKEELKIAMGRATCQARNDLKCLHRDESGEISVSSTSPNINRFLNRRGY
jgi:hypothetical protein